MNQPTKIEETDIWTQSNLTHSQLMLWLGQQLHPNAPIYNMAHSFTIEGEVDPQHFQAAFQMLIDRSDTMRTIIVEENGVPQQRVLDSVAYAVDVIDLSHYPDPDSTCQAWLDKRIIRRLDLAGSLFDCALIKLPNARTIWYFNQHHLVADMSSIQLIFRTVAELYQQSVDGQSLSSEAEEATLGPRTLLCPCGTSSASASTDEDAAIALDAVDGRFLSAVERLPAYQEFIATEQSYRQSDRYAQAETYWQNHLADLPEPIGFYGKQIDKPSAKAKRIVYPLGAERSARLAELAHQTGIRTLSDHMTRSSIFSSLLYATLHRISDQDQLVIGAPFQNRATPAFKETLGLFINILPQRIQIEDGDTFIKLIQKSQRETLTSLRHAQHVPRDSQQMRAYNVVLNYLPTIYNDFAGHATHFEWHHTGFGDSNHALRLQVHDFEANGEITLYFDVNEAALGPTEQTLLTQHFGHVLDTFLAEPDTPVAEIDLLSERERSHIQRYSDTRRDYPADQLITQLFEAQVDRAPHAIAVTEPGRSAAIQQLTYAELNAKANQLAHDLQQRGVEPDTLIGLCTTRSIETVIGILGVLKAGAAYVPIDASYPTQRIEQMLAEIQTSVLLTQSHIVDRLPACDAAIYCLDQLDEHVAKQPSTAPPLAATPDNLAYVIFTSGSTGHPKGAMIRHAGLTNYIWWAKDAYLQNQPLDFALFSSLSFDLTVTSIFTPLLTGGKIVVYAEDDGANDLAVVRVLQDDAVDIVKLTPAHLSLINEMKLAHSQFKKSRLKKMIVGGEEFKTHLAHSTHQLFAGRASGDIEIFNEYGPTEAVVGCMIHRYDPTADQLAAVPIGTPADNARIYVLDRYGNHVPTGVTGEMYVAGAGVARGYLDRAELSAERFLDDPFVAGERMYRTGDLARWQENETGGFELLFLGRADDQVKIRGHRIELGEIEAALLEHPQIREAVVDVRQSKRAEFAPATEQSIVQCAACGLPSNYPGVAFNAESVCGLCSAYASYKEKVASYFKTEGDLRAIIQKATANKVGKYDAVVLMSGGKDSTYMLYQVVAMGLTPLVFSLDNGYISDGAKANIQRVVDDLGLDLHFGSTPHMNAIFADSLRRHCNVCQGCFKTIYTLSMNVAHEHGIRYIFTGLARGQLFETRLTPEIFQSKSFEIELIDRDILDARKAYHRQDDLIAKTLDVSLFETDDIFSEIEFVDFYRYVDVPLSDVLAYLDEHAPWVRPSDTGRSTNCLINDVGIHVHKKQRGFHNYALPYSWDVRLGHKVREIALEELDDEIDVTDVQRILREIGYEDPSVAAIEESQLVGYYRADTGLDAADLRDHLARTLPVYMLPTHFVQIDAVPLTPNGKIDRRQLPDPLVAGRTESAAYVAPESDLEELIAEIWTETLRLPRASVGVHDNFFDLGGTSLPAIQIMARVNAEYELDLPLRTFFDAPTVAGLSQQVEDALIAEIEAMSDEEAATLIGA